ncbi:MAG: outer membrane protein assembly factor BamA [Candidatus Glassbacteria bacterium]
MFRKSNYSQKSIPLIPIFLTAILCVSTLHSQIVEEIDVVGNDRVSKARVLNSILLNEGDAYSPLKVQRAIKRLFSTGLFRDIQVFGEEIDGGLKLTFQVIEAPSIESVDVEGNRKVKDKKLRESISIPRGSLFNPSLVQETENKILALYEEEGYSLAKVDFEVMDSEEEGRVILKIHINEGKKVRVKRINFEGNKNFSDGTLRSKLDTEQDGWLPWHGTDYKESVLDEDLAERLPEFYRKKGFIDFAVLGTSVRIDEEKGRAYIDINVDEGIKYRVGKISFVGNTRFEDDLLKMNVFLNEGLTYDEERFEKSLRALYELYGNEGYIYASITPDVSKREDNLDITYRIHEGSPAHVRQIHIAGNNVTREKVIRRELVILPGDLFKQSLLMRSYQSLMNTGYFENVDIGQQPVEGGSGDVDLVLTVKERRTGQATTGAGFGAGGGLTGFIELAQSNLFGKGQKASARIEFGRRQNNVELSFTEPYFRDTRVSLGFDLYRIDQSFINDPFRRKATGGDVRVGVPVPAMDYTRLYTTYKLERFDLKPRGGTLSPDDPIFEGFPRLMSSVTFALVRDTRDNIFHPTRGTRHSISSEFAGGILGGNTNFQKYRFDTSWSMPTFWNFALTMRLKSGFVTGWRDADPIPLNEMFILGGIGPGIEGLRGYPDRMVGPMENGRITRGKAFILFTAEHELKITDQVYGVMFFDAGDNWSSLSAANPANLKRGLGFGIRIEIPGMGPLGIDLGYGLDRIDGPGWETHFTFGSFFY